ncbi:MAG: HD-GYP domain-containing protein [Gemmatimonadota bacterium]|nr:HD-GYP domain-containing protein [Gemmatimonadota bacterium]
MSRIARYVTLVCIAALGAGIYLFLNDPTFSLPYAQAALAFGFIGVLAQLFSYRTGRGSMGSVSFIPVLASAAIAPHWISVVVVAAASLAGQIVAKRDLARTVFNGAQESLSLALAILAYQAFGGIALHSIGESSSLSLFALFLVFFVTNSICVSGALGIVGDRNAWTVWKENTLSALPYDFLSLPAILFIVWAYSKFGPVGVFVFAVPLFGLRQLYKVTGQLEQTNRELLELMVAAIEARDPYTSGHSRRVADKARVIARSVGLREKEIERIAAAALLHDVGKIHEVFGPILSKPGRLTPEEQVIMRTHPIKSAELAGRVTELRDVVPLIRHHHENWDGTGYPDGLGGDDIPLGSRIIMFADTIDAMTTDRPYRAALDPASVRKELLRYRGTQFDPSICDALLRSPEYSKLFTPALTTDTEWPHRTPDRGSILQAAASA